MNIKRHKSLWSRFLDWFGNDSWKERNDALNDAINAQALSNEARVAKLEQQLTEARRKNMVANACLEFSQSKLAATEARADAAHDALRQILALETAKPNGTTQKIMRIARGAVA